MSAGEPGVSQAEQGESLLAPSLQAVVDRCGQAGIPVEVFTEPEPAPRITLHLPCAKSSRSLSVRTVEFAEELLSFAFEQYRYIEGYLAVYSTDAKEIVAQIRPASATGITGLRMHGLFGGKGVSGEVRPIRLTEPSRGFELEIGPLASPVRHLLGGGRLRPAGYYIALRNFSFSTHDQALALLEEHANSVFFQIDAKLGVPIQLARRSELFRRPRRGRGKASDVTFPRLTYDAGPMSLYWYGRGAQGMPLLQFLAFYQVMEYYFPVYSQQDMRRRLRAVVQDPGFSPDSDSEIGRLVAIAASTGGRGAWGDEQAQLTATIKACCDPTQLRVLIEEESYRGHFTRKRDIVQAKIQSNASDDELLSRVAERLYEIRCKIVHTKSDRGGDEIGLLLPFSKEADMLGPEIDLAETVARQILAAGGQVLQRL